jgi:hypothetical protein
MKDAADTLLGHMNKLLELVELARHAARMIASVWSARLSLPAGRSWQSPRPRRQ